jgi:selenide,water dikinase
VKTGVKLADGKALDERVVFSDAVPAEQRMLFFDPQTSGGLLIAVAQEGADRLLRCLVDAGIGDAAICGEVFASKRSYLEVAP